MRSHSFPFSLFFFFLSHMNPFGFYERQEDNQWNRDIGSRSSNPLVDSLTIHTQKKWSLTFVNDLLQPQILQPNSSFSSFAYFFFSKVFPSSVNSTQTHPPTRILGPKCQHVIHKWTHPHEKWLFDSSSMTFCPPFHLIQSSPLLSPFQLQILESPSSAVN